jgi:hypothetical protein
MEFFDSLSTGIIPAARFIVVVSVRVRNRLKQLDFTGRNK